MAYPKEQCKRRLRNEFTVAAPSVETYLLLEGIFLIMSIASLCNTASSLTAGRINLSSGACGLPVLAISRETL
ncbi:hypothetical protein T08_9208 [Trichinella sp. T8]|nr:hypothetical protein T08_9208 [Trichinella sp. T8]